jgi:predicted membrane protein
MPEFDNRTNDKPQQWRKDGRLWTGIFILIIGVAALLKASLTDFPDWLFSWQTLLIAIGLFLGIRHNFRDVTSIILILIGGIFLINEIYPEFAFRRYMWPVALIAVGLFIVLRPRRIFTRVTWGTTSESDSGSGENEGSYSSEDYVEGVSIFGGSKKNIISKKFRGGDLVNIFGGTELDLTQADFSGTASLELTTIFGGTKLIVPSNWSIKSEAVTIFGGLDDKRKIRAVQENPEKILVLTGTVIFGGIEIKSY